MIFSLNISAEFFCLRCCYCISQMQVRRRMCQSIAKRPKINHTASLWGGRWADVRSRLFSIATPRVKRSRRLRSWFVRLAIVPSNLCILYWCISTIPAPNFMGVRGLKMRFACRWHRHGVRYPEYYEATDCHRYRQTFFRTHTRE